MKVENLCYAGLSAVMAFVLSIRCSAQESAGIRVEALDDSLWNASEWISAADAPVVTGRVTASGNWRAADGASWFVAVVRNDRRLRSAVWMTSALGVYDVYVNGCLVGEEVLKPGFTHYAKTRYSFTYDITDAVRKGRGAENVFSAQVTPGWWADKIITPSGHDGMVGKKCAFRGVLELTYSDGTREYVHTDRKNWKAGIAGPVKHSAIFDGECYDAREAPGHLCIDMLSQPELNTEFNGSVFPSDGAEIYRRTDMALAPAEAYVWKEIEGTAQDEYGKVVVSRRYEPGEEMAVLPGETLVIDFGQNAAAVPAFVFKAEEGTVLTCLPSEILNDGNGARRRGMDGPEGSCHRLNLRTPDGGMMLEYTFADNAGYVSYSPRCTFYGYRYVSITATAPVKIRSVYSVPVTSLTVEDETGHIVTGNSLVNRLISNTWWGMCSNYLSVPTDCPQRNERLGWTADTQVFAETGTFFAATDSFMHKWMRDMRDTQTGTGAWPGVAPVAQYGASSDNMMRLGWADAGVIVPWTIWKQFGDISIVEENWDSMELFVNHIDETRYDHTALIAENGNYQWADWLSYEPLESCSGRAYGTGGLRPETVEYWNYLGASYWAIDAGMMRDMAAASGRDASVYEEMEARAKDYLRTRFFDQDGHFKTEILNTMQTPALFALKNRLFEGKAKEDMIARLRQNFADNDNCLQTGFLGTSILMGTLTENGMADIAYELLFQRKNPSWLYSVDNGATTIWERWNSYMVESGMGPKGMNSFNHYAYGCVCEWLWETVAGISCDASAPGFRRIIMKPIPDRNLGYVDAAYESASGLISSSWKYDGDRWIWDFTVPEGAVADVTLPGRTTSEEYGPGTYHIEM